MNTTTTVMIVIAVIALLVIGAYLGTVFNRYQRTRMFRRRFGPEYDALLSRLGNKKEVEQELEARLDHVKSLDLRPLSHDESEHFTTEWRAAQARFVDEPVPATRQANRLIREVMQAKGYPVDDFEQRAADISVDFPELVDEYRALHNLARPDAGGDHDTEELRRAMLHGHQLFEKLVTARSESQPVESGKEPG